ncbi:tropomyosin [Cotesia glomerata]|nr:tropomyosin [Cotesia glomerata]
MEIDQFDGIQKRLQLILAGINKVRDDLDLDKEQLKSNVKKIGSEVNKIERSFKSEEFELVDLILEEVTLIKEEMRSGREEMKVEIQKLSESVAKLDKKCRRINDDSEDLHVRLNSALDEAKVAEERLEEERGKNDVSAELVGRLKERERQLEEKLEGMSKKMAELNKMSEKTQVSFSESKSQETWLKGENFVIKDYKVSEEVREVEFNFKKFGEQDKIVRRTDEVAGWNWLEKMEDRMTNIVIKGLKVQEDNIVEQVSQFIELKLNAQIKVLAAKYFEGKDKERALLVKLESEEDVEEVMRRHKFGMDGIFIEYGEMTPQRELRKQLKIIVEKQLKHTNS